MKEKAKFLLFCMIFVGSGAFGQKSTSVIPPFRGYYSVTNQQDTPRICNMSVIKSGNKYFIGYPKKIATTPFKTLIPAVQPVITSNFYTQNFGFFCKKELQLEKVTGIPFKFRLGSVQQCDWMEGKPNAGKSF
ncbi:hypothetical protein [Ferruginibacter sp. SUN106]|uniref:hypothetical protein n=1 Tax=Ferruginibacter sp. SUN106 TaxID=2978348 RepID=UPI003D36E644